MTKPRRVNGQNHLWKVHVEPSGSGDVSVTLASGATCSGYAGICTSDGRVLSNQLSITVSAPGD